MSDQESVMNSADLLVELGCEELPPKTLKKLAQSFYDGVCKGLSDSGFEIDNTGGIVYYTPRRLGFRVPAVSGKQPDQSLERRGPAVSAAFDADGNPTQAALGFARSVGREVDTLDRQKTEKGEWLYCRVDKPGKLLSEVLYPVLEKALATLPVAKPMRWSDHEFSFVRPVHWLVVMHGAEVLTGSLYGKQAGNLTRGHRIHNPGPHEIKSPDEYESVLRAAFVMVNPGERMKEIRAMAEKAGSRANGFTRISSSLLDEVTNIVEWPTAINCRFEETFLQVPEEALIASMEDHQKFFPVLETENGALTANFIVIANIESTHVPSVEEGFERVIRPRLADAQFFWDQDKKQPLDAYVPSLDQVVFQKSLGSVGDKSRRIEAISTDLAEVINISTENVARAAHLCKADLLTQMVGEFPELQGTMGTHYARASGEPAQVAAAIGEHYSPRFAGDEIPPGAIGQLLSIADRMDTLVGIFAAGMKPSGNKDPFALRRAALGTVRILTEADIPISLDQVMDITAKVLGGQIEVSDECLKEARAFVLERLRRYLMDQGYSTNVVNAVFGAPLNDLPDLRARLEALSGFMDLPVADSLVAANKRIGNIIRKSDRELLRKIDADKLFIDEERRLFEAVEQLDSELVTLFEAADYPAILGLLAGLDGVITAFFDHVMVMDEDLEVRDNRLALLSRLKGMFDRVADLAQAT